MEDSRKTFGQTIAESRRDAGYSLKYVAARVKKEDGEPITHQYLSDLERDRRLPPQDKLIKQLAEVLGISETFLYIKAKRLPPSFDTDSERQARLAADAIGRAIEELKPRAA